MNAHRPSFLSSPIVRTLPATAFDPAQADVKVRIDQTTLTLEHNGSLFVMRWDDLLKRQKSLCAATPKQLETYQFIKEFIGQHKYSPSLFEISYHFQLKSINAAWKRVNRLIRAGLLRRNGGNRGLGIVA